MPPTAPSFMYSESGMAMSSSDRSAGALVFQLLASLGIFGSRRADGPRRGHWGGMKLDLAGDAAAGAVVRTWRSFGHGPWERGWQPGLEDTEVGRTGALDLATGLPV